MSENTIRTNTPLSHITRIFPDVETLLRRIDYGSVARAVASLKDSGNMTIGNVARAAGLTELEIGLLIQELNERAVSLPPDNTERRRRRAA